MYKVEVDRTKKLIKFHINGFFKVEEAEALLAEMENAFKQFKPKEPLILCKTTDFKPVSASINPMLQKLQAQAGTYGKKVAVVYDSVVPETQMQRLAKESGGSTNINRFRSEEEAMKFLLA